MDEIRRSLLKRLLIVPATSALYACVPFLVGCQKESISAGNTDAGAVTDATGNGQPDIPQPPTDDGAKPQNSDEGTKLSDEGAKPEDSNGGAPEVNTPADSNNPPGAGDAAQEDVCTSGTELEPITECKPTGADMEGPFYESGAPVKTNIAAADEPGEPLIVQGQVVAPGCKDRLTDSVLDVWQANANGDYYNKPGVYRLRGKVQVDCDGRFAFQTILPGAYLDGGGYRPKHIHITIAAPGYASLTTQLYFAGDPYLNPNDSCGVCQSGDATHIIALTGATIDGKAGWTGQFNVVLA
jgi:catechol 1,2-dioxygenase